MNKAGSEEEGKWAERQLEGEVGGGRKAGGREGGK